MAFAGIEEKNEDTRKGAKQASSTIILVEENNREAILCSATEFQQTGTLRMPIPYREGCAYTIANGK